MSGPCTTTDAARAAEAAHGPLLPLRRVAELLERSERGVYDACRRKRIPSCKVAGRLYVPAAFLARVAEAAMAEHVKHDPAERLRRIAAALPPRRRGRRTP